MATYERVTYGSPDGAMMSNASSEPLGFYGTTPTVQLAISSDISSTASISTSGVYGLATSTEMLQVVWAISSTAYALKQLGLVR